MKSTIELIRESNAIENIHREPTDAEVIEFERFMELDKVTVDELIRFVSVYAPGHRLRDKVGLDVRVGGYYPPRGDPTLTTKLLDILYDANSYSGATPHSIHVRYEMLHPFTDGNGRSGRMLWHWMHRNGCRARQYGFLHYFYYETLQAAEHEK